MNEYILNHLTTKQLVELARQSATYLATASRPSFKMELYYIDGQFIELSFCLRRLPDQSRCWQLYSANHFPNIPATTKYLAIYSEQILLPTYC